MQIEDIIICNNYFTLIDLPDLYLSLCRISRKQFVAILKMFLYKLRCDISTENVFQWSDNLYYEYVQNLTM